MGAGCCAPTGACGYLGSLIPEKTVSHSINTTRQGTSKVDAYFAQNCPEIASNTQALRADAAYKADPRAPSRRNSNMRQTILWAHDCCSAGMQFAPSGRRLSAHEQQQRMKSLHVINEKRVCLRLLWSLLLMQCVVDRKQILGMRAVEGAQ